MQIAVEKHYLVFSCLVLIVEIETSLNNLVARVRIFPQKKNTKIDEVLGIRCDASIDTRQWEKKDLSLTIDFQGIRIRMKAAPATNERK